MLTLQTRQWQHWRVFFWGERATSVHIVDTTPATTHIASAHPPPFTVTKQTRQHWHMNGARHHQRRDITARGTGCLAAPVSGIRAPQWLYWPTLGRHLQRDMLRLSNLAGPSSIRTFSTYLLIEAARPSTARTHKKTPPKPKALAGFCMPGVALDHPFAIRAFATT